MKPFDIRTVTSSMYSAADDDRTSNSMPSFPTNGMDINSNTVNGYRINSNSIFDIQSVFRTSQGEIVNVAVQRNAVSSGERKGKVVRKKRGNTNSKEDETSQYDPSVLPSNPLTQSLNTTIQPTKKPRRRTRGFKPRFSYQNQKARRSIQKVFIDTTLPVQPVLAGSRHSSRYSLILFTTADSHPVYHFLYSLI